MKITSDTQKSHKVVHSKIRIFDEPFWNLLNLILSCWDEIQKFFYENCELQVVKKFAYYFIKIEKLLENLQVPL